MKLVGIISTAVLSLTLGVAAPAFAAGTARPAGRTERQACGRKPKPESRTAKPEEKTPAGEEREAERRRQQENNAKPEEKSPRRSSNAQAKPRRSRRGRIPDDRYKANFGQGTHVSCQPGRLQQSPLPIRRLFVRVRGAWPSNWLYTQNVYVIEIDGVYYLCNASYPGVNIESASRYSGHPVTISLFTIRSARVLHLGSRRFLSARVKCHLNGR
jgi:hypothetical protein